MSGRGMGGHQSHRMEKDEWLTPPHILEALGPFDLVNRPWPMATKHYTIFDDGLSQPWEGRVWCNPPYGPHTWLWLTRLAEHGYGTALTFARTETDGFFRTVWTQATALLFLRGRLFFHHVDGRRADSNSGAPSVLIAYGAPDALILRTCGLDGVFIDQDDVQIHGSVDAHVQSRLKMGSRA